MTDKAKGIEAIENLIESYIFEHKLANGSALPTHHELALKLECDEELLVQALKAAESKQRLAYVQGTLTVVSPETITDHSFSFTKSAGKRGLTTKLIEAAVRFPMSDKEHPYYLVEQRVQEALGLNVNSEFIVIERLRLLDGRPGAFQRAYLNPARFPLPPTSFLTKHNFETESLIDVYQQYGYKLLSRDTVLAARSANLYEKNTINRYRPRLETSVVLDAEQRLYAEDATSDSRFVIEFLKASYLENWQYEIKNRPA
jgi:DNA-binding GntR family transcriptional regulator